MKAEILLPARLTADTLARWLACCARARGLLPGGVHA